MNKYVKPTISLLSSTANSKFPTSCNTSKEDADMVLDVLASMGINPDNVFGLTEGCQEPFMFEDYCKFTSSIQVFLS